jgi:hypothetical protein
MFFVIFSIEKKFVTLTAKLAVIFHCFSIFGLLFGLQLNFALAYFLFIQNAFEVKSFRRSMNGNITLSFFQVFDGRFR